MNPVRDDEDPDERIDPLDGLAIIDAQRAHVLRQIDIDGRLLFGAWGIAWLVGYLALYVTADGGTEPSALGFVVYGTCLVGALVLTVVHIARRSAGLRGESSATGTLLGIAWGVASLSVLLVNVALARLELFDTEAGGVLANTVPCLVVGLMYMAQGAAWLERRMLAHGAWICVVTAVAAIAGLPSLYLVMAFAGGGAFLLVAVAEQLARGRRP